MNESKSYLCIFLPTSVVDNAGEVKVLKDMINLGMKVEKEDHHQEIISNAF